MKRRHEGDASEEEPEASMPRKEEESRDETEILQDLHSHLVSGDLNGCIEKRLFETQKQYFTVYMEKLMHKIPMGEELVKIIQNRNGPNDFEYMFTAAKSVIQSQMQVKQIKAFHAVFDMAYSLMCRYVHEKVVSPALHRVVSIKQLNSAYEKYQTCSKMEEDGSVVEMQCLLYCIQEMLDNQEPVKIPNPLYSRLTQQMKAMSDYVIALLLSLSNPVQASAVNETETQSASGLERESESTPTTEEILRRRPVHPSSLPNERILESDSSLEAASAEKNCKGKGSAMKDAWADEESQSE